ncbi:MAG: hypothetical protein RLY31_1784 [Bacteroidota bacterium]|jgi:hypothetical protein
MTAPARIRIRPDASGDRGSYDTDEMLFHGGFCIYRSRTENGSEYAWSRYFCTGWQHHFVGRRYVHCVRADE